MGCASPLPIRLLIVEDDRSLRQMMCLELEELGYSVTSAGCCAEALAQIQGGSFDLALLDYHLPDGVGSDLMEQIHLLHPRLPVILCSGLSCSMSIHEARARGACRFLAKPITIHTLDSLIRSALAERH